MTNSTHQTHLFGVPSATVDTHSYFFDYGTVALDDGQDCLDNQFVIFTDKSEAVLQDEKRALLGECVVTGRQFEAVFWYQNHRIPAETDHTDIPWQEFYFDGIQQYEPELERLRTPPAYQYLADYTK